LTGDRSFVDSRTLAPIAHHPPGAILVSLWFLARDEDGIRHGFVLTPGRYAGAMETENDGEPFAEKMARLTATLNVQFVESGRLEAAIRENVQRLGLGA